MLIKKAIKWLEAQGYKKCFLCDGEGGGVHKGERFTCANCYGSGLIHKDTKWKL